MPKSKKQNVKIEKQKQHKDPRIEEIYEEEVTFTCPVRGIVKQKVKIKRYKQLVTEPGKQLVASIDELTTKLEEQDDGLSIYNDGEELNVKEGSE